MRFFLRYCLPITYFRTSRLNRLQLVAYNGLVEWIPAFALSFYYAGISTTVFSTVVASYMAFISLYEIGYITNDFFSERAEANPRGRRQGLEETAGALQVWAIIFVRLIWFAIFTLFLGVHLDTRWIVFQTALAVTFTLHNLLPPEARVTTFFGLSTFRYFAPIILILPIEILTILLPTILLNNSLYRVTVYLRNKNNRMPDGPESVGLKFAFYVGALPLSGTLAFLLSSWLPLAVCTYFMLIWALFYIGSQRPQKQDNDKLVV